jgi:hypothetical protein
MVVAKTTPSHAATRDDWRRVEVGGELRQLFEDLRPVEDYNLLAITADTEAPVDYLKRIRLFTKDGVPLEDASRFIYWLPIEFISKHLHSISIVGSGVQHSVGSMHVAERDGLPLMAYQRRIRQR